MTTKGVDEDLLLSKLRGPNRGKRGRKTFFKNASGQGGVHQTSHLGTRFHGKDIRAKKVKRGTRYWVGGGAA